MNTKTKVLSIAVASAGFSILIALVVGIFLMVVQLGDISVQLWTVGKEVRDLRANLLEGRVGVNINGPVTTTGCTNAQIEADTNSDPSKDGPCGLRTKMRVQTGVVTGTVLVAGDIDVRGLVETNVSGNIDVGTISDIKRGSLDVDANVWNEVTVFDLSR